MEAPEFGLNDYEGLNVEGKIVVMLQVAQSSYLAKKALTCLILSLISLRKRRYRHYHLAYPVREEVRKYETVFIIRKHLVRPGWDQTDFLKVRSSKLVGLLI